MSYTMVPLTVLSEVPTFFWLPETVVFGMNRMPFASYQPSVSAVSTVPA